MYVCPTCKTPYPVYGINQKFAYTDDNKRIALTDTDQDCIRCLAQIQTAIVEKKRQLKINHMESVEI